MFLGFLDNVDKKRGGIAKLFTYPTCHYNSEIYRIAETI
jgi:hypothetical protein